MADPAALAALVQGEHTDAVKAVEDRVYEEAAADTDARFEELVRRALVAWVAAFGAVEAAAVPGAALNRLLAAVRAAVRRLLDAVGRRAPRALDAALAGAVTLGGVQGAEFARAAKGRRVSGVPARPTRRLRDAAAELGGLITAQRDRALGVLAARRVRRWTDVLTAVGAARGALARVRAHIAWVIGVAVNEGLAAGIRAAGVRKLWVAEATACVTCAAYSGMVVDADADFPGGLSLDPQARTYFPDPIPGPPRHPHCRCRVVAWHDSWTPRGEVPLPEWLRREAAIAVARGWSPASESTASRVRAVRELLRQGAPLPPHVLRVARTAARTGRFPARAATA